MSENTLGNPFEDSKEVKNRKDNEKAEFDALPDEEKLIRYREEFQYVGYGSRFDFLKGEIDKLEGTQPKQDDETQDDKTGRLYYVTRQYSYDSGQQNKYAGISEKDWIVMIKEMIQANYSGGSIDYMAYVFHDKDKDEDGNDIQIHCHILMRFKDATERSFVKALFEASSDENCAQVKSGLGKSRYLVHVTNKAMNEGKHIYQASEVTCLNCKYEKLIKESFWQKAKNRDNELRKVDKQVSEEIADELGLQIRDGKIRKEKAIKLLEEKAGYSWVRKLSCTFDDDQEKFIKNRVIEMTARGRDNTNIYIMGSGGIGKSYLGRELGVRLANNDPNDLYISAPLGMNKTPDALNSYVDEKIAIFNEISARGWSIDEYLACFDPYSYTEFPSRNSNKDFIGDTSIFTNSASPLRFVKDLLIYSKGGSQYQDSADKQEIDYDNIEAIDKYWQARRRFHHMIVLLHDENDSELVHGYVFNFKDGTMYTGTHVLVGNIAFENKVGQAPSIDNNILNELQELMLIDVDNMMQNVKTIDVFLEENGIVETSSDSMIDSFIDEVINETVWDLLPVTFIYDLYREYRNRNFPTSDLLNRDELMRKLEAVLKDWERKLYSVRVANNMTKDEPLISEYDLERWISRDYNGQNRQKQREFRRQKSYQGFVRK